MSNNTEQWTDAELVARCRAGDKTAWDQLVALYVPAMAQCIALCRHRHWWITLDIIEDAAQEVFYQLLRAPEQMLAKFRSEDQSLTQFLARLMWQQVGEARRRERLGQRRERLAGAETDERRRGPGLLEERIERAMPRLSRAERMLLQGLLDRTFFDQPHQPSKGALRLRVYRIRVKVERSDDPRAANDF